MPSTSFSTPSSRAVYALGLTTLLATNARAALNAMTYVGCYSSSAPLTDQGSYQYQTTGWCQPICVDKNQAVLGLSGGSDCWCGDLIPAANTKVDDSKCSTPCNGFGQQNCGGTNFWSVYLSGTTSNVGSEGSSSSSSNSHSEATSSVPATPAATTSPPTSAAGSPTVITSVQPGTTIIVTQTPAKSTNTSPAPTSSSSSGSNTAGIAAGVVVGFVAVAAIAIGTFLLMRRRRRQAAEDDFKRATQANAFMNRKPPPSGHSNMSDARLDPEAGRRNSSGSIADDQDYSRKILRVANPDSS